MPVFPVPNVSFDEGVERKNVDFVLAYLDNGDEDLIKLRDKYLANCEVWGLETKYVDEECSHHRENKTKKVLYFTHISNYLVLSLFSSDPIISRRRL